MIQAVVVGLVLGAIYAIAASGVVITYVSTGILNFAFGAMAFFIARVFYYLNSEQSWGILPAVGVSLLVVAPLLGVVLYAMVFRLLRLSSQLVKIVCTIGVSVALPALVLVLVPIVDAQETILFVPGLAPEPVDTFENVLGTGVTLNLDQVIVLAAVALTLLVGGLVLRFTVTGLKVRALVDSEAMTGLSGTNPGRVAIGVWVTSTMMAGLAGILLAPTVNLDVYKFTLLTAAAFAAVVAARLRNLATAVVVALAMGVTDQVLNKYLPHDQSFLGSLAPYLRQGIPFLFMTVFLLYFLLRGGRVGEDTAVGGPLDHAIRPQVSDRSVVIVDDEGLPAPVRTLFRSVFPLVPIIACAVFPVVLNQYWGSLVGLAMGYAMIMLSYTLVSGEGGMIWLCQITFGAIGAIATATLASDAGWPLLPSILAAAAIAAIMGTLLGALTIRLGDLYVALVTLTFALLMDQLVFQQQYFSRSGTGFALPRPDFASGNQEFAYLALGVFCALALVAFNVRKSTAGMSLSAVRWSEPGARMLGVGIVQMKMLVAGLAAVFAAVGGTFLGMFNEAAQPDLFNVFLGLVWLAVLVNFGIRSIAAAALAGMVLAYMPNLLSSYVPDVTVFGLTIKTGNVLPLLFGLGAVLVAKNPDGVLADYSRRFQAALAKRSRDRAITATTSSPTDAPPSGDPDDAPVQPATLGGER